MNDETYFQNVLKKFIKFIADCDKAFVESNTNIKQIYDHQTIQCQGFVNASWSNECLDFRNRLLLVLNTCKANLTSAESLIAKADQYFQHRNAENELYYTSKMREVHEDYIKELNSKFYIVDKIFKVDNENDLLVLVSAWSNDPYITSKTDMNKFILKKTLK